MTTGPLMTLSQCSNSCLRDSSLVAFLFDFDTNRCKLLTTLCKQTTIDNGLPSLYMYDQCKYKPSKPPMYDQCKYSWCVNVITNHPSLNMYGQCKDSRCVGVSIKNPNLISVRAVGVWMQTQAIQTSTCVITQTTQISACMISVRVVVICV